MSLYKRGNVYWAIWSASGVRYQKSTGTSNRRQAEKIEQQYKDDENARRHGLPQTRPDLTFGTLGASFLAQGAPKAHHIDRLKHLLPFFAEVPIGQISKGLVSSYRQVRQEQDSVSPATVNRDVSVLRRILYWSVEQGLLAANPIQRVKMERERRTKRPVMSVAEEDLLLRAVPKHVSDLIVAAVDTGMRRGELTKQRWEDVDLERAVLSVTRSKTPEGEAREIPLTARLSSLLAKSSKREGLLFTYGGRPIKSVKTAWKTALKDAGIRHFRFHDLRHTCATRLLEAGVLQEVRMAILGHSSREKVHSIYTHIELPTKRAAIAALERWMEAQRNRKEGSNAASEEEPTRAAGQA